MEAHSACTGLSRSPGRVVRSMLSWVVRSMLDLGQASDQLHKHMRWQGGTDKTDKGKMR